MTSTPGQAYQYNPLEHPDSIRLIEILSGSEDSPLSCNIVEVRKDSDLEYEALSYAWGEPVFPHVVIEAKSNSYFSVTTNLHNALKALRHEDKPRLLWADAICINQTDLKEKGHQVVLMGQIFHGATRVVVWLGENKAVKGRIITILSDLVQAVDKFFQNFEQSLAIDPFSWVVKPLIRLFTVQFFEQAWFNRVWVVQEFILARDLQLFTAHDIIPLELFQQSLDAMQDLYLHALPAIEGKRYGSLKFLISEDKQRLREKILRTCNLMSYRRKAWSPTNDPGSVFNNSSKPSLARCVIDLAQGRECKDPRDFIYAMLGLAHDGLGIEPDYTRPFPQVISEFATSSLLAGDLSVLHASGCRPDHDSTLPSFVPGISYKNDKTSLLNAPELNFSAASAQRLSIKALTADTISLRGVEIDTVADYLAVTCPEQTVLVSQWAREFKFSYDDFVTWSAWAPLKNKNPYADIPLRDLFTSLLSLDTPLQLEWQKALENNNTQLPRDTAQAFRVNRVVFQTGKGYFGMGPRWMEKGDKVVIFDGACTPFLLRKQVDGWVGGEKRGRWKLVGDCFLLGWMRGEMGSVVVSEGDRHEDGKGKGKRESGWMKYLPWGSGGSGSGKGVEDRGFVRGEFVLC